MIRLSPETLEAIERALKRGNSIELKRENGNLVAVEIVRKVRIKQNNVVLS